MATIDCGYKEEQYDGACEPCSPCKAEKKAPRTFFPSFSIQGDAAKAFAGEHNVGDIVEFTVKCKVISTSDRSDSQQPWGEKAGSRVELELHEMSIPDGEEAAVEGAMSKLGEF